MSLQLNETNLSSIYFFYWLAPHDPTIVFVHIVTRKNRQVHSRIFCGAQKKTSTNYLNLRIFIISSHTFTLFNSPTTLSYRHGSGTLVYCA